MNLMGISSVRSYTSTLKMQTQWGLKQASGNVTAHASSADEWLGGTAVEETDEEGSDRLQSIMMKVYSGGKLTDDEKEYIRLKAPQAYQSLKSAEQEQKSYEQALKKCRTKEEVQRLKMSRLGSSLAAVKSVENNPHIGTARKLEICMQEKYRMEKVEASTRAFVKSGRYAELPTEAEQAEAEQALREAEQAQKVPDAEETEKMPAAEQTEAADEDGQSEPAEQTAAERKSVHGGTEDAKTEGEAALESPAVRRVRRARAKQAYAASRDLTDTGTVWNMGTPTLNLQA